MLSVHASLVVGSCRKARFLAAKGAGLTLFVRSPANARAYSRSRTIVTGSRARSLLRGTSTDAPPVYQGEDDRDLDLPAAEFDSIADALAAVKAGELVVVLDDESRENEGDLIIAADRCHHVAAARTEVVSGCPLALLGASCTSLGRGNLLLQVLQSPLSR